MDGKKWRTFLALTFNGKFFRKEKGFNVLKLNPFSKFYQF
jgi:hypothetical protein